MCVCGTQYIVYQNWPVTSDYNDSCGPISAVCYYGYYFCYATAYTFHNGVE